MATLIEGDTMKNHMDKSLFFLTISMVCIWLVVDVAVGKNRLGSFLSTIFPFMEDSGSSNVSMTPEEVEEAKENAPKSSAMGSEQIQSALKNNPLEILKKKASGQELEAGESVPYDTGTGINTVPYAAILQGVYK